MDSFSENLVYYSFSEAFSENAKLKPINKRNPVLRLPEILENRNFTEEDVKDINFVLTALQNQWITFNEIENLLSFSVHDDAFINYIINTLKSVQSSAALQSLFTPLSSFKSID